MIVQGQYAGKLSRSVIRAKQPGESPRAEADIPGNFFPPYAIAHPGPFNPWVDRFGSGPVGAEQMRHTFHKITIAAERTVKGAHVLL
ncbi:hypothetical protein GCM10028790_20210 [Micromonospora taraxaci]